MTPSHKLSWGPVLLLLLRKLSLRHLRRDWRQTAAIIGIIAAGVAVVLAVRLANRAASASFTRFTDAVAGSSDWIISPAVGDFDDDVLPRIRTALSGSPAVVFPVVEATAAEPAEPGTDAAWGRRSFQLLGVDLVALRNLEAVRNSERGLFEVPAEFQAAVSDRQGRDRFWDILESGRGVFVPEATARDRGWRMGDRFRLVIEDRIEALEVAGVLPTLEGQPAPASNLLVMDLPGLRKLVGRPGRIDRVELWVEAGPGRVARITDLGRRLEQAGGNAWIVESPQASGRTGETMTAAFRLNLTILSLLALAVGSFLVVEALDGAVVRRRNEIAVLRSLGVPPRIILRFWLVESLFLGLLGSLLGVVLGVFGAQFAVQLIGRTINALYFQTTVDAASLRADEAAWALGAGILVSLLAGWLPARSAAATQPAELLPRGKVTTGPAWSLRLLPGVGLFAAGALLALLPGVPLEGGGRFPVAGYLAAGLWLASAAWLTPGLLSSIARFAKPIARNSAVLTLALSRFSRPSARHRLAVAGLVVAVGMTASMAVMISSFDTTVRRWIGTVLQADLFIASDGAQSASSENRLAPATWQALMRDPAVLDGAPLHGTRIRLDGMPTFLSGADFGFLARRDAMAWTSRPAIWPAVWSSELGLKEVPAVVSEAFSVRFGVKVGDIVSLPTEPEKVGARIVGVFADYGNERGTLMLPAGAFVAALNEERAATVTLVLHPGQNAEQVANRMQTEMPGLRVLSQSSLRSQIVQIFNQTFAITHALEVVGLVVAIAGLALSLAGMLLDRRDELSTLRSLGMSHSELARTAGWEGAFVALSSAIGGVVLSIGLGWLLIHVINRQSFGWTLGFDVPWTILAALVVAVTASGGWVCTRIGRGRALLASDREE